MIDAAAQMSKIDSGADALDESGKALADAIEDLAQKQRDYEAEYEKAILTVTEEARGQGKRPPAEDIRRALAHQQIKPKLYGDFLMAKARVEGISGHLRALVAEVNARQSLLKALTEEAKGGTYAPHSRDR